MSTAVERTTIGRSSVRRDGDGSSGGTSDAFYIVKTADASLPNAIALDALASLPGFLYIAADGTPSIHAATGGTITGPKQVLFSDDTGAVYETVAGFTYDDEAHLLTITGTGAGSVNYPDLLLDATATDGVTRLRLKASFAGGALLTMFASGATLAGSIYGVNYAGNAIIETPSGSMIIGPGAQPSVLYLASNGYVNLQLSGLNNTLIGNSSVTPSILTDSLSASTLQVTISKSDVTAAAGARWDGVIVQPSVLTLIGSTTTTTALNAVLISQPTITGVSAQTITGNYTFKVAGSPVASAAGGTLPTLTNRWGAWFADVVAGDSPVRIDSFLRLGNHAADAATVPDCLVSIGPLLGNILSTHAISMGVDATRSRALVILGQSSANYGSIYYNYNATPANGSFNIFATGAPINLGTDTTLSPVIIQANGGYTSTGGPTYIGGQVTSASSSGVWGSMTLFRAGETLVVTGTSTMARIGGFRIYASTVTNGGGAACTVTSAAALLISAAPVAGGTMVITNSYSVDATGPSIWTPTKSIASASGGLWDGWSIAASTLTVSGAVATTEIALARIGIGTLSNATAGCVYQSAASLIINGVPALAGANPGTITYASSIYSKEGTVTLQKSVANFAVLTLSDCYATGDGSIAIQFDTSLGTTFTQRLTNGFLRATSTQGEGTLGAGVFEVRFGTTGTYFYDTRALTGGTAICAIEGGGTTGSANIDLFDPNAGIASPVMNLSVHSPTDAATYGAVAQVVIGTSSISAASNNASSALFLAAQAYQVPNPAAAYYWAALNVAASTVTLSGTGQTITNAALAFFGIPTITKSGGNAFTVSAASTLYIAGSPVGSSVTLTNTYAVFVDTGLSRFDGDGTVVFELPADATANVTVATGRIPVKITGVGTKYIRYYDS